MERLNGFLIDLDGVLYVEEDVIPGAVATIGWLRRQGYPFRFLTNTTMRSRASLAAKLLRMGIPARAEEVVSTSIVAARWLARKGIRRLQLLLPEDARKDFAGFETEAQEPEAVVVGDLGRDFNFDVLNAAFLSIRAGARLVALQKNRFWLTATGPALDVGAFVTALEYATETEAILVGKPNPAYFEEAVSDLGLSAREVAMIGDDIESDIRGAQAVGLRAILVKTGRYGLDRDRDIGVVPDWVLNSIADLPGFLAPDRMQR